MTELRAHILNEGMKGLLLMNGGGAVALATWLQAVWGQPWAAPMLRWQVYGMAVFAFGVFFSVIIPLARYLGSLDKNTLAPLSNMWWWTHVIATVLSILSFAAASGLIVYGALKALPLIASAPRYSEDYFSCTGKTGIAVQQSALSLLYKEVTSNESKVDGSIHITDVSIVVDGIPFVANTYKICQIDDQAVWFSPSGSKDYCAGNDQFNDLGVFNKVTGKLSYHAGDFLAILQCKKTMKLMK